MTMKPWKLALIVHLRETFGADANTAVCRVAAILVALYAIANFLVNIFYNPYDAFGAAIGLLIIAYAIAPRSGSEF